MKTLLTVLVLLITSFTVHAGVETVLVEKEMDDKAIVVRTNGERYLIEKGVGCLSLWRYEGKHIYIDSPGIFLGVGSSLLLPDGGQQCRIWDSEFLGYESTQSMNQSPHSSSAPPQSSSSKTYEIEGTHNDEVFIINGGLFKAKTYCFGWYKGDKVIFIKGSPSGVCTSATLYNVTRDKTCEVWCE